jgi:pimeloyl-ACP methyl ester carboxylesterase
MGRNLDGPLLSVDLGATATAFEIPIFFIQGAEDNVTPSSLAHEYLDRLTAPQKAYVEIQGSGHAVIGEKPDAFLAALNEHVRPLVTGAVAPSR